VPLRDGIVTRAEAWVPDGPAGPAILVRTPYLKETAAPSPVVDVRLATERGYRVVVQDVRGRGSSEGEFEPFVNEERDGADQFAGPDRHSRQSCLSIAGRRRGLYGPRRLLQARRCTNRSKRPMPVCGRCGYGC